MERRTFLRNTLWSAAALSSAHWLSCSSGTSTAPSTIQKENLPKISLAQWSLHRKFQDGKLDATDFAAISKKTYGIEAVEYVASFYEKSKGDVAFWTDMKKRADENEVKSLLIMVDGMGDLGAADEQERKKAIENHYDWVDAAKTLGCHSIRVNAFGADDQEIFRNAVVDGLVQLASYAAKEDIHILIENHGLFSSNAKLITDIIKATQMDNVGTLPDFGNWCQSAKWGSIEKSCENAYDPYQGVAEFMPFAKGVSAKSYQFDEAGNEIILDYQKMLKIVKSTGFDGYIGIEYEGEKLSEHDGILATKALIETVWQNV